MSYINFGLNNSYWTWNNDKNSNGGVPVSLDELLNFEYDGTNYIYDLPPANNNLFWAGNMCAAHEPVPDNAVDSLNSARNYTRNFYNAQFRIQSISLKGLSMRFTPDEHLSHRDYFTGVELIKTVSITWLEDAYYSVQKYHQDWICNWYDSKNDCFLVGSNGKFRQLDVVAFHYKQKNSIYEDPTVEPVLLIAIRGMVPEQVPGFEFNMSTGNASTQQINYRVNQAMLFYNIALRTGAPIDNKGEAIYKDTSIQSSVIWAPIVSNAKTSDENNRILHQVNSTLPSEGRLM